MMVRELRGGTPYATYLTGPRGTEYRRDDTNGAVKWYVYDGLGSVVGEIDPSGNMTATRSHDVYGLVRNSTGQRTSAHGFVGSLGHTSEDNTGLIYMQARYMDPVLGRFASEDPGKDRNNWFAYCSNDPVNMIDKNGQYLTKEITGAFVTLFVGLTTSAFFRGVFIVAALCFFAPELVLLSTPMMAATGPEGGVLIYLMCVGIAEGYNMAVTGLACRTYAGIAGEVVGMMGGYTATMILMDACMEMVDA